MVEGALPRKPPGARGNIRVLHVEDDAAVARMMRRGLKPWGVETETAATLASACTALGSHELGYFDVALLDLQLPDGDGTSLLPLLRELGIPALVLSGSYDDRAHDVISWNAFGLSKSVSCQVLASTIRGVLDRRRTLDQRFAERHGLSEREVQVIAWSAHGLSSEETAGRMACSASTVNEYWQRVFHKLGVHERRAAVGTYVAFHEL